MLDSRFYFMKSIGVDYCVAVIMNSFQSFILIAQMVLEL